MKSYLLKNKALLTAVILLSCIVSVGSAFIALILSSIIDTALAGDLHEFRSVILQSAGYFLLLGILCYVYSLLSKKYIRRIVTAIRSDTFRGIFHRNVPDFKKTNSADYLSALTNDVKLIEEHYLVPFLMIVENIIVFIAAFILMLLISPLATLCLIAAMVLLIIIPSLFQKQVQNRQDIYSKKLSALTVKIKDFLSGFDVIRSYRMMDHVRSSFHTYNHETASAKACLDNSYALLESISTILGLAVQSSVMFVSAWLILQGSITAGTMVALITLSGYISAPIQILSQSIPMLQGSAPVIERVIEMASCPELPDSKLSAPSYQHTLSIENLSFCYDGQTPVLQNLTFLFEKNKKYAITGKSGCGKSTLMQLVSGTWSDYEGRITYDGSELSELNRDQVSELSSIIHQNVYMFDESIHDNICLHKDYPADSLTYALKTSGTDLFLDAARTLGSAVGENGSNLSGGQRQRIAVARALIERKPMLILDESTSAIDKQTAYDIEHNLLDKEDLTLFTITHSLHQELLERYDEILFMENGTITEHGSFHDLLAASGSFADFYHIKKDTTDAA